jgi:hypothetical protein
MTGTPSDGTIGILNVGAGDTKLTFDKAKPAERDRAARVVTDMLKRGFAILVQVGTRKGEPLYQRAKAFDPKTCEYIIVGAPDDAEIETPPPAKSGPPGVGKADRRSAGRGKASLRRIPAEKTRATAVARSAGG